MGESTWAQICAQAKNHQSAWEKVNGRKFALVEYHQSAWEKVNGLKFQLVSRIISQPNGGTRKITQGKFYLSTYKDATGRTLPCYTITEVAMMLNTQISQI